MAMIGWNRVHVNFWGLVLVLSYMWITTKQKTSLCTYFEYLHPFDIEGAICDFGPTYKPSCVTPIMSEIRRIKY